jgi:peptidyl-tRNA hydrolase
VGGTNLTDPEPPSAVAPGTPLVLLSPHVELSTGKAMAQAAHASQLGWRSLPRRLRRRWVQAGFPVAVRDAAEAQWQAALERGAPVVHDGGFTEVAPGTPTALFTTAR